MEEGELVAERYRLVSPIGRGAMGVVWLARDERLDRDVAVKQLLVRESPDQALQRATPEEAARRGTREARIAARLRHPNAIAVHDVVTHDGRPCLIMEYLESEPLDVVLIARGGLPPAEAAAIVAQVAAALLAAHAAGIVHRDVKPENVLIAADGLAKITDFGVARAAGLGTVTTTGILAGTPAYLAPEVAAGGQASPASDVYSLGATVYTAIEGMPPYGVDDNPIALLLRVATGESAPPQRSGPLTGLLQWMLHRDPAERPSMETAHAALLAAAAGRSFPVPAPRTGTMVLPTPPRRRSRRAIAAGVAAVALLAVGLVAGVLVSRSGTTDTASPPPSSTTTTTSSPTPQQPIVDAPKCEARYDVGTSWQNGYNVTVTVRNTGTRELSGWVASWTLPAGHQVVQLWEGDPTQDGDEMTVRNLDWNTTIPAGDDITFGFTASTESEDRPEPVVSCQSQ
jgi:serine/threonine protein kinase